MTKSLSPLEESAGRYACLLYDSTVKTVLGVQENEDLLIEILQFLIPGKRISSITVGNKEKHGLVVSEKVVIFDLLCRDADTGEEFLVEVQNAPDKTFKDRALYYSLVPVREQMEKKQAEVGKKNKRWTAFRTQRMKMQSAGTGLRSLSSRSSTCTHLSSSLRSSGMTACSEGWRKHRNWPTCQ